MNFIDFVIILFFLFYAIEGASAGFMNSLLDLMSFVLSFAGGLTFYLMLGKFLSANFAVPVGFANAIGFFIGAFAIEIFANFFLRTFIAEFLSKVVPRHIFTQLIDKLLGAFTSTLSGVLLASFILTMAITLPLSSFVKHSISSSKIAGVLTSNTQNLSGTINSVFGGAINETLSFLTIEPKSNQSVDLNFKTNDIKVDEIAEAQMFGMVNKERESRGIKPLSQGSKVLVSVARAHCEDMFKRGYFSHYTPEGLSPFDRMTNAGITFLAAGENLALAPNVDLAMRGLMQSPGHRENILSTDFGRLGVGVIDGGIYGEMFCQEFTN